MSDSPRISSAYGVHSLRNWIASCARGSWFQLKSLAHTTFFMQNAAMTPICFALMKILVYMATEDAFGLDARSIWVDAAIAGLWSATTTAVGIIGYQRFLGTLQYLATSVIAPSAVFLPIVASAALLGIIGVPLALVTVAVCLHGYVYISGLQILGVLLAMLACVASAALLAGIFVLFSRATAYEPLILIPVWMLSGIVVPVDTMPLPLRVIAFVHPLTSAVWVSHASMFSVNVILGSVLSAILSVILLIVAGRILRYTLKMAIKEGSLNIL